MKKISFLYFDLLNFSQLELMQLCNYTLSLKHGNKCGKNMCTNTHLIQMNFAIELLLSISISSAFLLSKFDIVIFCFLFEYLIDNKNVKFIEFFDRVKLPSIMFTYLFIYLFVC